MKLIIFILAHLFIIILQITESRIYLYNHALHTYIRIHSALEECFENNTRNFPTYLNIRYQPIQSSEKLSL